MSSPSNNTPLHFFEVTDEQAGQRIDNFLLRYLKGVPKSRIYRILRKGEVRVNKKRVKPTHRLESGSQIRIPPIRSAAEKPAPTADSVAWIEKAILYEDEWLLVLNKPSGIAVHGGSGIRYGLIEGLRALRSEAENYELVHRLDRATSGLLLVAKRRSALRSLHELIRNHEIEKRYLALVAGKMRKSKTVLAPLQKSVLRSGERVVRVDPEGKSAESHFRPQLACNNSTLVEVEIVTGRTHQIRVHGAHINHPLAGDERYGDSDYNLRLKKMGLDRLFLHAHRLTLAHPKDGSTLRLEAPLPDQLNAVLEKLRQNEPCRSF
ncbi:MAG: 23S rRNA pseudouridine(955/2504/2580) synthase RluC [Gammaproteobacteria bacterium]|jgi:23S rRNA pseudouridine955/2504/2580 synthase|nr:23S rRNA pseudouridine(955/2504/2580) synthase RluC [Gammaproteobacteria bacterium]MBT7308055.1 23S rRNA pseudouridine(955/2504/2580) synthase RluC [Gammaproteobacteria bacterium]